MKKLLLAFLLICTAALSGCWDINEPERMLYINGMGIDFQDGKYEVYVQIIDFANTARMEQPTSDQPQAEVGYASGETIDDAINTIYHSVDQKVFWGHFSYLIVSEEVLKQNKMAPIIDSFIRYRETRYQIWVYTTKDPVQDVLLVRPVINKALTLSKLGDPENSFEQESFIYPVDLRELIIALDEPGYEAGIPLIKIKENWQSMKEKIKAPLLSGIGVISPKDFKGFIEDDAARGLQWMNNETKRGEVTFSIEDGIPLTVIIEEIKVKIKPVVDSGVKFNVDVQLHAVLSNAGGNYTYQQIKDHIEKKVHEEIMETYEAAIEQGMDPYKFSEKLYRKKPDVWKRVQKDGLVELTEDSIGKLDVKVLKLDSERKSFKETIEK